jgi:hypothetical protein
LRTTKSVLQRNKLLLIWVCNQQAKGNNVISSVIMESSDNVKVDEGKCEVGVFASNGWFDKF